MWSAKNPWSMMPRIADIQGSYLSLLLSVALGIVAILLLKLLSRRGAPEPRRPPSPSSPSSPPLPSPLSSASLVSPRFQRSKTLDTAAAAAPPAVPPPAPPLLRRRWSMLSVRGMSPPAPAPGVVVVGGGGGAPSSSSSSSSSAACLFPSAHPVVSVPSVSICHVWVPIRGGAWYGPSGHGRRRAATGIIIPVATLRGQT